MEEIVNAFRRIILLVKVLEESVELAEKEINEKNRFANKSAVAQQVGSVPSSL